MKENYEIARSITRDHTYLDMLTEEESQKIFELKQEINRIYETAKERYNTERKSD